MLNLTLSGAKEMADFNAGGGIPLDEKIILKVFQVK